MSDDKGIIWTRFHQQTQEPSTVSKHFLFNAKSFKHAPFFSTQMKDAFQFTFVNEYVYSLM